jgi:hypothetical protein
MRRVAIFIVIALLVAGALFVGDSGDDDIWWLVVLRKP